MTVVALVPDLMDQSRIRAALGDAAVTFVRDPARTSDATVVVVDLARFADRMAEIRASTPARIVAFGPHVDDEVMAAARSAGADVVLARSQFFRDPGATIAGS